MLPLVTLLAAVLLPVAPGLNYPACRSDSDCYDKPLWRCTALGLKFNYSDKVCVQLPPANWDNFTLIPCPAGAAHVPSGPCHTTGGLSNCTCLAVPVTPTPVAVPPSAKPKYLMVGDSVSIGMEKQVFSLLNDTFEAYHNPRNADNANLGAHSIQGWLQTDPPGTQWGVITFQFGLHGLAKDQELLTVDEYSTLLGQITKAIQQHGQSHSAKVLFATTTPVPTNLTDPTSSLVNPPRFDRDVQAFNAAAKRVMQEHSVPVLDLYNFVHSHCVKPGEKDYESCDWQLPNNVHYEDIGWTALAQEMAAGVRKL